MHEIVNENFELGFGTYNFKLFVMQKDGWKVFRCLAPVRRSSIPRKLTMSINLRLDSMIPFRGSEFRNSSFVVELWRAV